MENPKIVNKKDSIDKFTGLATEAKADTYDQKNQRLIASNNLNKGSVASAVQRSSDPRNSERY